MANPRLTLPHHLPYPDPEPLSLAPPNHLSQVQRPSPPTWVGCRGSVSRAKATSSPRPSPPGAGAWSFPAQGGKWGGGGQGVTGWEGESIAARLLRAEAGPGLERPCPTRAPT